MKRVLLIEDLPQVAQHLQSMLAREKEIDVAGIQSDQATAVALMDGVMQFGTVRHVLQVPPATRSFVDLPTAGAMRTSLAEVLWEGPSGIHVLLAPGKPEEVDLIQGGDIGSAMNMLAESHDYLLVDTPSAPTGHAL